VEEELRHQRELMQQGFAMMDKRFESMQHIMDKRFEQVDKRFEQIDKRFDFLTFRFDRFMRWPFGPILTVAGIFSLPYSNSPEGPLSMVNRRMPFLLGRNLSIHP